MLYKKRTRHDYYTSLWFAHNTTQHNTTQHNTTLSYIWHIPKYISKIHRRLFLHPRSDGRFGSFLSLKKRKKSISLLLFIFLLDSRFSLFLNLWSFIRCSALVCVSLLGYIFVIRLLARPQKCRFKGHHMRALTLRKTRW